VLNWIIASTRSWRGYRGIDAPVQTWVDESSSGVGASDGIALLAAERRLPFCAEAKSATI